MRPLPLFFGPLLLASLLLVSHVPSLEATFAIALPTLTVGAITLTGTQLAAIAGVGLLAKAGT